MKGKPLWTPATLDVRRLPPLLTSKQVAALIGNTTDRSVRMKAASGELPAVRYGSQWRFPTKEILRHYHLEPVQ